MKKPSLRQRIVWCHRAWRYRMFIERPEVRFALDNIRPGDIAVDIGAHKGGVLYWLLKAVGPQGKVVAFEPQPELAAYLESLTSWRPKSQVQIINSALSERPGTLPMMREGNRPWPSARLVDGSVRPSDLVDRVQFDVRVETLDRVLSKFDRPVRFIKCDVEGHELEVFRGARRIIDEDRPYLLFECERRHHDGRSISPVFEFLTGIGYEGAYLNRRGKQPIATFRPEYQDDPASPDYVNNFAFLPRRRAA